MVQLGNTNAQYINLDTDTYVANDRWGIRGYIADEGSIYSLGMVLVSSCKVVPSQVATC